MSRKIEEFHRDFETEDTFDAWLSRTMTRYDTIISKAPAHIASVYGAMLSRELTRMLAFVMIMIASGKVTHFKKAKYIWLDCVPKDTLTTAKSNILGYITLGDLCQPGPMYVRTPKPITDAADPVTTAIPLILGESVVLPANDQMVTTTPEAEQLHESIDGFVREVAGAVHNHFPASVAKQVKAELQRALRSHVNL